MIDGIVWLLWQHTGKCETAVMVSAVMEAGHIMSILTQFVWANLKVSTIHCSVKLSVFFPISFIACFPYFLLNCLLSNVTDINFVISHATADNLRKIFSWNLKEGLAVSVCNFSEMFTYC